MFTLSKKKTLVVEDFTEFARSVRAMLQSMGATDIDVVHNAEDALESCKNKKYDIILSDYNLGPKKDGQQFLEEISKYKLIKSNCVFLMLTAENSTAMVMGAVEYQPDAYIAKPFNGNFLKARLEKNIEKKDILQPINRAIINKKWQQSLENIQNILISNPKYKMSCLRLKYKTLINLKRLDEALELVSELNAKRAIPWVLEALGEIYYLKGQLEKSADIFKNMITEFPMSLEGYDWLAKIQKQVGQSVDAQNTLMNALKKSPKALDRQKKLGEVAEENEDLAIMTKAYRNAVKCGKNSAFASPDEYVKLTKALSKTIQSEPNIKLDHVISEAEELFKQLDNSFSKSNAKSLRNNIAHAEFYKSCNRQDKVEEYLTKSEKNFNDLDEQLLGDISLEVSKSFQDLGRTEIATNILNEAIMQNLDAPEFIKKATKISTNDTLIKACKMSSKHNIKAISYFKKSNFTDAIDYFEKAHSLVPNNINIRLNYIQSLLKQVQLDSSPKTIIELANNLISNMPNLSFSDHRYNRFSELNRLTQLMLQKHQ